LEDLGNSSQCKRPLIEIDHCGKRLIGCVECNRWGWPGSDHLFMALPEDDLQALSNLSDARHKAEDTTPKSGSTEQWLGIEPRRKPVAGEVVCGKGEIAGRC
jgi:hypothetical protein